MYRFLYFADTTLAVEFHCSLFHYRGHGELAGATGTSTRTGRGAILSVDASGHRLFGWFKLTYTQTLTVPEDLKTPDTIDEFNLQQYEEGT
jgi:hypothetical protein